MSVINNYYLFHMIKNYILLFFLLSLSISCSQKQKEHESPNDNDSAYKGFSAVKHNASITDLQDNWNTNELILSAETKEYSLFSPDPDEYSYGNHITLNPDQTFKSFYTADCGNGCFTSSAGKYKIIDKNYICFYLETITKSGDCSGNFQPNRDLGLYYYYQKDKVFYLLKSKGSLEQDKKNIRYRDLIIAKRVEIEKFYENRNRLNSFMFNWKPTQYTDETPIVAFCMAENKIKNYELLYYDKGNSYSTKAIALVKMKQVRKNFSG